MILTNLDPRWLLRDGKRVGLIFQSPIKAAWYQSCMFQPTDWKDQRDMFNAALPEYGEYAYSKVQGCNTACGWAPTPSADLANFETLSVTPSIDGSVGGLWHGYITNGQIVGGI